jgi:hypothetical protein
MCMAPDIQTIAAFHAVRQNDWPSDLPAQKAALAKALDYQRALYPVRTVLTPDEQLTFNDAIALLALEMVNAPAQRASQAVKKLKEQSSSGAGVETEYGASPGELFPQVAAMLAPLAPLAAPQRAAVRFSRLQR